MSEDFRKKTGSIEATQVKLEYLDRSIDEFKKHVDSGFKEVKDLIKDHASNLSDKREKDLDLVHTRIDRSNKEIKDLQRNQWYFNGIWAAITAWLGFSK